MTEQSNVSQSQQTENVATGLRRALEDALRHAITYHSDGPVFRDKAIARASVELACKRLTELQGKLDAIAAFAEELDGTPWDKAADPSDYAVRLKRLLDGTPTAGLSDAEFAEKCGGVDRPENL